MMYKCPWPNLTKQHYYHHNTHLAFAGPHLYAANTKELNRFPWIEKLQEIDKDIIYPVNIGQKKGYSIHELAEICAKVMDYKGKLVYNSDYSDGAAIKLLDNKEFQKIFPGYVFTNLEDGIKNTIDYYQSILWSNL